MGKHDKIEADTERRRKQFMRLAGCMPWHKGVEKQQFRAKVFKSGNSLALRLPAGLNLAVGMETEVTVEDGVFFSFELGERTKRKFNIAKVAGSATSLRPVRDEDRAFVERELDWGQPDSGGGGA